MARTKLQTPNFGLVKRPDGYYDIRYKENGEGRKKSTGTKDANEAEAERARFVQDYRKPKMPTRPTVAMVCDAFKVYRLPKITNPKSLDYCFDPIKRGMGSLYAEAITQRTIADYIKARGAERPVRKGGRYADKPVGEATMSKELRMFKAALNWAASERFISRLPTFQIELSQGGTRDRWITKEEANLLIDNAPPHVALFITIAVFTAKRRQAILGLKWSDVSLHIPGHEILDFGADVGNKKKGKTPIAGGKRLIEALKEAKKIATCDYVIEFKGAPVKDVKTAMEATCRRANIEKISPHVLKHTAITWMVQADMTYERISKATNTTKEVIERVYGHHSPSFVSEAMDAVSF